MILRLWMARRQELEPGNDYLFLPTRTLEGPISIGTIRKVLKGIGEQVGIPTEKVFVHKLRSTWATDLHDEGVPVLKICALAGWNDPKTAMSYIRISKKARLEGAVSNKRWRELEKEDAEEDDE